MTREEAIEVYLGLINPNIKEAFEFFAPELAESEDERIRKAIIHYILYETKGTISEATEHTWVKWLERQKEHKPVQTADEKRYIRIIKSLIADFIRDKQPEYVAYYQKIYDWLDGISSEQKPGPISCSHENGTPAEVCYGPKGDPDPAGVWKPSEEQMEQNYIRKDALLELLQGMIQSCKTKNGFPADTLAAMRIDTIETVISRIEEICKEDEK